MVKTYCLYAGATFCLLLIQSHAMLPFGNHGIRPDLLLFLVINAAVTLSAVHCACMLLILGYVFEVLSGSPLGLFISTYLLVFAAIVLLSRFYNFNTRVELFGLLLLCLVLKYMVLYFFLHFVYEYHYSDMLRSVLGEAFFTIVLFPVFFPLIQKILNHNLAPGSLSPQKHSHGA